MNTLLQGPCRMDFYTNLSWVFRALGEGQLEFDWLLTDLECNSYPDALSIYDERDPRRNELWLNAISHCGSRM
jgi:hypothetical protein